MGIPFTINTATNLTRYANMQGHTDIVMDLSFSLDSKQLVSVSKNGEIRLWNTKKGVEVREIGKLETAFKGIGYTMDNLAPIVTAHEDGLRFWNPETGAIITEVQPHEGKIIAFTLSKDRQRIATAGSDGVIRIIDATTRATQQMLSGVAGHIQHVVLKDNLLAVATGKDVQLWDTTSGNLITTLTSSASVKDLDMSDTHLVTLEGDGEHTYFQLWDLQTYQPTSAPVPSRFLRRTMFSSDGELLFTTSFETFGSLKIWNVARASLVACPDNIYAGHQQALSPDGMMLATGGSNNVSLWVTEEPSPSQIKGGARGIINSANRERVESLGILFGHGATISEVAFHPTDQILASGGKDANVILWDTDTGEKLATFPHPAGITALAFTPDGNTLITLAGSFSEVYQMRFYNMTLREEIRERRVEIPMAGFHAGLAISPNGRYLAVATTLYDAQTGEIIGKFKGSHQAGVNRVAFNHDGSLVALAVGTDTGYSGNKDNAVKVYKTDSLEEVYVLREHQDWVGIVGFYPPHPLFGELVVGVDEAGLLYGWSVQSGELIAGGDGITAVAKAPSGDLVVVANRDKTLRLLDLMRGGDGHQLVGHTDKIRGIAFNPAGTLLASVGDDKTIRLWGVPE